MTFLHRDEKAVSNIRWNFDDACVFYSISVWNTNDGKGLVDVLLAGSLLTRNTFTIDVLKTSIPKLKNAGLITVEGLLFFLTANGKELFERVSESTNRSQRLIRSLREELPEMEESPDLSKSCLEQLTMDVWRKAEEECSERSGNIFR